jgi:hypothetical protein
VANNHTLKMTDVEVLEQTTQLLKEHLPLKADGYICTTGDLINILLGVAANCGTVQALGTDLVGSPDPETIRGYLREQLRAEDLPELERQLNAALAEKIPARCQFSPGMGPPVFGHDGPLVKMTLHTKLLLTDDK